MDTLDNHILDQLDPSTPEKSARVIYAPARICESCKQTKQIAADFAEDSNVCLVCQDHKSQLAHMPVERKALERVFQALEKGYSVPQSSDLLGFFYKELGGPSGVAKKLARTFERADAAEDHKVAARCIDMVMRLQIKVSSEAQQLALHTLSPEELRAYTEHLEGKLIELTIKNPLSLGPDVNLLEDHSNG